ncbi:MAG: hypothetical protein C0497_03865 [Gemmatimonas sp.]|nr:hypothetical protein [Gemmatimonas sp.]
MRTLSRSSLLIALLMSVALSVEAQATVDTTIPRAQRPVMMVAPFEFTATPSRDELNELNSLGGALLAMKGGDPTARLRQTQDNLGKAAAGMLMERLLATQQFRVVERAALDQIRGEQNLVASGAAAAGQTVAQQAQLLGAKYVITGQVTKFGKSAERKGGLLGAVSRAAVGVALERSQTSYVIGLTARIVDASTGEVIHSMTTDGVAVGNKTRMLAGLGGGGGLGLGGAGGSAASGEREAKIAEAIQAAVDKLVVQVLAARERGDVAP